MDRDEFIKVKFNEHKQRAKRKGIEFGFSWNYYYSQMAENDNWLRYGNGPGHLVWSRTCDVGGYWDGWARLVPWEQNQKERNGNHKNKKSMFRKHSIIKLGRSRNGRNVKGTGRMQLLVDGVHYDGYEEAAAVIGCHPRTLKHYLNGR